RNLAVTALARRAASNAGSGLQEPARLAMGAPEFRHEIAQGAHALDRYCVVNRSTDAAQRAMTLQCEEAGLVGLRDEHRFQRSIVQVEDHVHPRARPRIDAVVVITSGIVNGGIQELRFGAIASLHL